MAKEKRAQLQQDHAISSPRHSSQCGTVWVRDYYVPVSNAHFSFAIELVPKQKPSRHHFLGLGTGLRDSTSEPPLLLPKNSRVVVAVLQAEAVAKAPAEYRRCLESDHLVTTSPALVFVAGGSSTTASKLALFGKVERASIRGTSRLVHRDLTELAVETCSGMELGSLRTLFERCHASELLQLQTLTSNLYRPRKTYTFSSFLPAARHLPGAFQTVVLRPRMRLTTTHVDPSTHTYPSRTRLRKMYVDIRDLVGYVTVANWY